MSISIIPGPNVFRAVSGSLFSSPTNWSRGVVPTGSDVAMIADNCTIDISRTIGSLVVSSPFTASINTGLTLNISQSINVMGHLSCSGNPTINVLGPKNNINSLSPASSSFFYLGSTQTIPGVTYWTLSIRNPGIKKSNSANTTVLNLLNVRESATYDIANSNLTVSGTSRIGENQVNSGTLLKTGIGGSVLFIGRADFNNGNSIFSGNPRVEMRNGFSITNINRSVSFGDNDLYFTTNNQSIYEGSNFFSFSAELFNNIFISGGISLTLDYLTTTLIINRPINGLSANDALINKARLYFNSADSVNTMVTGGFDYSTFDNYIGYTGNYSRNMLPYSSSYRNLYITGTGVKTLPINTSVSGTLALDGQGTLDMGNYNLIVSGTSNIGGNAVSPGYLQKNTPGSIIFLGQARFYNGYIALTNNPTVEFRNGLDVSYSNLIINSNNIRFTTNNQIISSSQFLPTTTLSGSAIISGSINLTVRNQNLRLSGAINGFSASDTITNSGSIFFDSAAALNGSLLTGSSNFSFPGNNVAFSGNYSGTASTNLNTFFNLTISGTGIKTMSTSSVISGSLSMGTTGSLELGNNNLILLGGLGGPNDFNNRALFSKSGPGNILFASNITPNCVNFNLPGNPTVEFKNGANIINANFFNFGTGSVTFSTNNQTFQGNSGFNLSGSLIISGGITLTLAKFAGGGRVNIYNTINGTTGSSILLNNTEMYFYNSASYIPMATSGTFSYLNSLSTLGYMFDKDVSLPYTQYNNVYVAGTKSLAGDTYISGSMGFDPLGILPGRLELSSSSLFVSGTFGSNTLNTFISKNSNVGTLTFSGPVTTNGQTWQLTGNPQVEFRNGLRVLNPTLASQSFGSGSMVFSQNNQTISCNGGLTFANPITISGAINLTLDGFSGVGSHTFFGSINGTDPNSRLTIAASSGAPTITYYSSQRPMLTGLIDFTSSLNTFIYASGSQDVKGGIYRNLTFLNGLKTLQGNVSVLGTFSTGSGATSGSFNLNGFTLTNP